MCTEAHVCVDAEAEVSDVISERHDRRRRQQSHNDGDS